MCLRQGDRVCEQQATSNKHTDTGRKERTKAVTRDIGHVVEPLLRALLDNGDVLLIEAAQQAHALYVPRNLLAQGILPCFECKRARNNGRHFHGGRDDNTRR